MASPRYGAAIWLAKVVGQDVKEYLPEEARKLIYDFRTFTELLENLQGDFSLYDWSSILSPVCKAVESIVLRQPDNVRLTTTRANNFVKTTITPPYKKYWMDYIVTRFRPSVLDWYNFLSASSSRESGPCILGISWDTPIETVCLITLP